MLQKIIVSIFYNLPIFDKITLLFRKIFIIAFNLCPLTLRTNISKLHQSTNLFIWKGNVKTKEEELRNSIDKEGIDIGSIQKVSHQILL